MTERKYGVVLYTNGDREIITLALDLGKQINEIVGGYFESLVLRTDKGEFDMWSNEEGKIHRLPINHYATELFHMYFSNADVIVGNVLLTGGVDRDGNTLGLTQEEAELFYPNKKEN
jgi:hypothetical protein